MRKYIHDRFITKPNNINHSIFILGLLLEYPQNTSYIYCPMLPYLWLLQVLFLWLLLLLHQCIIVAMRMTVESGSVVAVRSSASAFAASLQPCHAHTSPKTYLTAFVLHFYYTHTNTHTYVHTQSYANIFRFAVFIRDSRTGSSHPHPHPHLHPRSRFNWSRWCYLYKCLSFLFVRPVCISFFWQLKL